MAIAVVGIVVAVLATGLPKDFVILIDAVSEVLYPNAISNRPRSPDAWYGHANISSLPDHCPNPTKMQNLGLTVLAA